MLNKRYIKSIKRDIFWFDFLSSILVSISFLLYIGKKRSGLFCFDFLSNSFCFDFFSGKYWKRNVPSGVPYGRDISFPIFIRKEIETRKLERKSK